MVRSLDLMGSVDIVRNSCFVKPKVLKTFESQTISHTHIHTYTQIYIYIYIYMCVCICVCIYIYIYCTFCSNSF
jgi:hypothetical protein